MNLWTRTWLIAHLIKWRLTWSRRNTHRAFTVPGNPKFMGPRDAIKLIPDGAVIGLSGLGATQRISILCWAMRELFEETGHPHDLTVMAIGGFGGRGKVPGTVEEIGLPGLTTRFFAGHYETFKSILRLGDAGQCELQCLPQGVMARLFEAQQRGEYSLTTKTGLGTFLDPRHGRGTPVLDDTAKQYVAFEDGQLRYHLPKIDVAMFNVPAADRAGNLYIKNCSLFGEAREIARAARAHNGLVIANVGLVVDEGYDEVFLPSDDVDAIVVWPGTEQVGSIAHRRYWPCFTTDYDGPIQEPLDQLNFANHVLGITPRRTPADAALARLAASIFAQHIRKGSMVNIGVGLPEQVCRWIDRGGASGDIHLFAESGVVGGAPAPGVFFGTAIRPEEIISSVEVFQRCYAGELEATILGVLQADSDGNVNVSKRGEGGINYVGPGGFGDFTTTARHVFFVSSWMAFGRFKVEGGRMRLVERGAPKFIEAVDEITFNGRESLKRGQKVFYISHVGAFQLTERGMELICVMPGIDVQEDILNLARMHIVLPESGEVPVADPSIVTGENFRIKLKD